MAITSSGRRGRLAPHASRAYLAKNAAEGGDGGSRRELAVGVNGVRCLVVNERATDVIRKLVPVGVWVFLICFGLIAVDLNDNGWFSLYVGIASIALAGIMFWIWKD